LDYFKNNKTFPKNIPGTYSNLNQVTDLKNFQKTEKQIRIKKIDEIQWPDWEGFPLENYFKEGYGFGVNLGRSMPIIASRGCPYQCTFCSNPNMWTTLWKARDPKDVVEEMKFYLDKYQISNFDFYDLTAIVKKKWIVQFCNLLVENNLNITWQLPSGTRSEAIDRNVAKLLYKSGCRNLSYAPESGSNEILVLIKKKIKLEKMIKSMKDCVFEGLSVKVNIICGFPSEKWKHLIESLKFITQIAWVGCDDMSINQFSPYPGSELFEDLIRTNKVKLDEKYFIGLSYYSSMTNADSYSRYLSNQEILIFKFIGTSLFYAVNFMRRPWRLFLTLNHVYKGIETTRIEKTLNSYIRRSKVKNGI